jgi:hypothetical protein
MKSALFTVSALMFVIACEKSEKPAASQIDGNSGGQNSGYNQPNVDENGNPVSTWDNNSDTDWNANSNWQPTTNSQQSISLTSTEAQFWFQLISKANGGNLEISGTNQTATASAINCQYGANNSSTYTDYNNDNGANDFSNSTKSCAVTAANGTIYTADANESETIVTTLKNHSQSTNVSQWQATNVVCNKVSTTWNGDQSSYNSASDTFTCALTISSYGYQGKQY